jgi:hypothetical protein
VAIALAIDALRCRPGAGETKVGDLQRASKIDKNVGRLEVEVNVARVMDEAETLRGD